MRFIDSGDGIKYLHKISVDDIYQKKGGIGETFIKLRENDSFAIKFFAGELISAMKTFFARCEEMLQETTVCVLPNEQNSNEGLYAVVSEMCTALGCIFIPDGIVIRNHEYLVAHAEQMTDKIIVITDITYADRMIKKATTIFGDAKTRAISIGINDDKNPNAIKMEENDFDVDDVETIDDEESEQSSSIVQDSPFKQEVDALYAKYDGNVLDASGLRLHLKREFGEHGKDFTSKLMNSICFDAGVSPILIGRLPYYTVEMVSKIDRFLRNKVADGSYLSYVWRFEFYTKDETKQYIRDIISKTLNEVDSFEEFRERLSESHITIHKITATHISYGIDDFKTHYRGKRLGPECDVEYLTNRFGNLGSARRTNARKEVLAEVVDNTEKLHGMIEALFEGLDPWTGEILDENHFVHNDEFKQILKLAQLSLPRKKKEPRPESSGAGSLWTSEEEEKLIFEFNQGMSFEEIGLIHERTRGGIRARLIKLGLIDKNYKE